MSQHEWWAVGRTAVVRYRGITSQLALTMLTRRDYPTRIVAEEMTKGSSNPWKISANYRPSDYEVELTGKIFVPRLRHPMFDRLTEIPLPTELEYAYIEAADVDGCRVTEVSMVPNGIYTGPDTWSLQARLLMPFPSFYLRDPDEWQPVPQHAENVFSIEPQGTDRPRRGYAPRLKESLYVQRVLDEERGCRDG